MARESTPSTVPYTGVCVTVLAEHTPREFMRCSVWYAIAKVLNSSQDVLLETEHAEIPYTGVCVTVL